VKSGSEVTMSNAMRKLFSLPIIFSCYFTALGAHAADMLAPDVLARTVTEEVLAIIRADKDLQAGDQKKVNALIETKIAPHFSFTSMTRLAMGRNWSRANAAQRKTLVDEFRALLVRTYTTAFTQYKNQTIEYRPLRMAPNDDDVVVKSLIKQPSGLPVAVDYNMEKTDKGWKVYNVKIEGISLVENYRNTFNSEVQRSGIDGLIGSLAEKNRTLAQAGRK
jgi:phospholipid transport system substrate-binding protein